MRRRLLTAMMMTAALLLSSTSFHAFAEKRYLMAVGVDRYQSLDVEFDLHGASADVANVVKVLGEKFGFGTRPEWVLLNNAATFTKINAARTEVERQVQSVMKWCFTSAGGAAPRSRDSRPLPLLTRTTRTPAATSACGRCATG